MHLLVCVQVRNDWTFISITNLGFSECGAPCFRTTLLIHIIADLYSPLSPFRTLPTRRHSLLARLYHMFYHLAPCGTTRDVGGGNALIVGADATIAAQDSNRHRVSKREGCSKMMVQRGEEGVDGVFCAKKVNPLPST